MCGRTASSLNKEAISRAAAYRSSDGTPYVPCDWFDGNTATSDGKPMDTSYEPHFNQTSGHYLPVLVRKRSLDNSCKDTAQRVLVSMRWGLQPHWIKSGDSSSKINPINCRFETMAEKKTFSDAVKNGRRCVVLVDGFFEWKTNKDNSKDPYFLYFPQKFVDFKSRSADSIKTESQLSEDNEWKGPRLLTIAGLFNKTADNCFTFTVITVPNHKSLEWLHDRMPAILDSEDSVRDWLDFERVSVDKANALLVPFGGLEYHSVSRLVSNSRNNSIENIWPQKPTQKQKTIDHWFTKPNANKSVTTGPPIKDEKTDTDGIDTKKFKH